VRRLAAVLALVVGLGACGGGTEETSPTPSGTTPSASPTPSLTGSTSPSASASTPTPTVEPTLQLPADAPTLVDDPADVARIAAGDYAPLAPPGATVTFPWVLAGPGDPIDQVAFSWQRGDDPFALENGFAVWQPSDGGWRAVYAFTDTPAKGVLGVSIDPGDLTGDGIEDALTFEQTGGSGACGTWRVVVSAPGAATEVFRDRTCDAEIRIVDGDLQLREAVFAPGDAHCCPSAYRISTLEWDGTAFVETSSETRAT
jgi:hypothetical protein